MGTLVRVDVGDIVKKNAGIDVWEFVGTLLGVKSVILLERMLG